MAGSPSRGAATSDLILDNATTGGAPRAGAGTPAPRQHPLCPRTHCFGQSVVPHCYQPPLNSRDEQLSCFFCHPLTKLSRPGAHSRARCVHPRVPSSAGHGASRSTRGSPAPASGRPLTTARLLAAATPDAPCSPPPLKGPCTAQQGALPLLSGAPVASAPTALGHRSSAKLSMPWVSAVSLCPSGRLRFLASVAFSAASAAARCRR
eukprot:2522610-Rhodomonas_salina.1